MESMPTTMAIIGAVLMAATKNNMLAGEMSPFLTTVEPGVMRWFAAQFSLGPKSGGGMLAGGTLANIQALATARNVKVQSENSGIWGRSRQPVFFASEAAHSSLRKAAMVMGLGSSAVVAVRADGNSRMDAEHLRRKVRDSLNSGQEPIGVVATAGTTITGNIDPLADIGDIAEDNGLWFHVDAAYGGALAFSKIHRHRLRGIENADSVTFNLHKWAYLGLPASMLLFKDLENRDEHFRISAPYMSPDARSPNLGEFSLQGSRQADVIGLLLSLQHLGRAGYASLIDSRMELALHLRTKLEEDACVEFTGDMDTNIVCFRPRAAGVEDADARAAKLQDQLLRDAGMCLTVPFYRGHKWLKADILNPVTDTTRVDFLAETVRRFSEQGITRDE